MDSYARRGAADSAAFLLPFLRSGWRLLDVGCGPGSITLDLAGMVSPGEVVGVDREQSVIERAQAAAAARAADNVRFIQGSVYRLPFEDGSFDVVFLHQVCQHLARPVAALGEARRVLRRGGLLGVRDSDYGTMVHAPHEPGIDRWLELHHQVARSNGAEPDAGRFVKGWVEQAGFEVIASTASASCMGEPAAQNSMAEMWARRITEGAFAEQAIEGFTDADELSTLAEAWRAWATRPGAWFGVLQGEVVARNPPGAPDSSG